MRFSKPFSFPRSRHQILLLPLLISSLLASCSGPTFQRSWKQAASQTPADPICGQWTGTWKSEVNGHQGRLQCVVTSPTNPGEPHEFFYRATWMRILSGSYRAKHTIKPTATATGKDKATWTLSGEHQMPSWAGGLYTYKGKLTPTTFSAEYDCELDRGTYSLQRPDSAPSSENTLAKTNAKP